MFRKICVNTLQAFSKYYHKNGNNPESQAYIAIAENLTLTLLLGSY